MSSLPPRHFKVVYVSPKKPEPFEIRRIFIDPEPQTEPSLTLPVSRAEPEQVALTAAEAARFERQRARKRVEAAAPAPDNAGSTQTRISGSKAEWAHAQRNVDNGSAPISLTEEQIREQNEAASRWAERAEREHNARRAAPKGTSSPRSSSPSR